MNTTTTSPAQELLSHTLAFCDDCLNHKDFTGAWQALCRALTLAPNRADILCHRGRLALYLKDTETARRDFTEALKFDPRCAAAWAGLARYHWQQGEPVEAEVAIGHALGIDPTDEEAAQVKAEIQAERLKARPRELNSTSRSDTLKRTILELVNQVEELSTMSEVPELLKCLKATSLSNESHLNQIQASLNDLAGDLRRRTVYLGNNEALTRLITGHKMYVDTRDVGICSHLMLDGHWEPWISSVLMRYVKPGMRVMDIGANFGYYTMLMSSAVGHNGKVFSVEANPRILSFLKRSISVNGLGGITTLIEKAAFDRTTNLQFSYDIEYSGGGHVSEIATQNEDATHFNVQAIALDSVIEGPVQVIKIDVEGAEESAFRGMKKIIDQSPQLVIVMEYYQPAFQNPTAFLDDFRDKGFKIRLIEIAGLSGYLTSAQITENHANDLCYLLLER